MLRLLVLVVVEEEVVGTKAGLCRNGPVPAAAAASGIIREQAQTPPIIVIRVGRVGVIAIDEADSDWGGRFLFGGSDKDIDWMVFLRKRKGLVAYYF